MRNQGGNGRALLAAALWTLACAARPGECRAQAVPAAAHPPSKAEIALKAFRRILDEQGFSMPGRSSQNLDWAEISRALKNAGTSPVFTNKDLLAIAGARGWRLSPKENGTSYLVDVLDFMQRAVEGRIPGALSTAIVQETGRQTDAFVAVSLEDTDRFIEAVGEKPGAVVGSDVAVMFRKESGVTGEDIFYAMSMQAGRRPEGFPLGEKIGSDDKTVYDEISRNDRFGSIDSSVETFPGSDRAFGLRKVLRKGGWFVKDHEGHFSVYVMSAGPGAWAMLIQLDERTPSRDDWDKAGKAQKKQPIPIGKGTLGLVLKDLGPDGWAVLERFYHRGQDVPGMFMGMVHKGQMAGARKEKADFIRLVLTITRLRLEGRLPPLGTSLPAA
ncbi:MAG TPA: hypothetical protein DCZ01_01520 [Elusimicrobia bacterium]|nr:MAG: hypothetical protein A2X37_03495 [Elusimicrobia bacterium GWA2_66_18]OGR74767.1 MAG: hypothetical protein A2X40_00340 [Elusimicrobia bacterium GWC2_65_9]HAZ07209.1 hypothetical protein [Elusimicrobiota bacterium]